MDENRKRPDVDAPEFSVDKIESLQDISDAINTMLQILAVKTYPDDTQEALWAIEDWKHVLYST